MSTSWSSPDGRRTVAAPVFGGRHERTAPAGPPLRQDLRAGGIALSVTVLLGAPVGLLWALLAPKAGVVVAGDQVQYADPYSDGLIAVDGAFLGAVVLAGLVGGLLAWRFGRAHGPAVVVALAVGGLAAAKIAQVVGETRGLEGLRAAVRAGGDGAYDLFLELQTAQMLVGWPVASLLGYLALTLLRERPTT